MAQESPMDMQETGYMNTHYWPKLRKKYCRKSYFDRTFLRPLWSIVYCMYVQYECSKKKYNKKNYIRPKDQKKVVNKKLYFLHVVIQTAL